MAHAVTIGRGPLRRIVPTRATLALYRAPGPAAGFRIIRELGAVGPAKWTEDAGTRAPKIDHGQVPGDLAGYEAG